MPILVDGPARGRVRYNSPYPPTLVVATRAPIRFHDYLRLGASEQYRHSPTCPACTERGPE